MLVPAQNDRVPIHHFQVFKTLLILENLSVVVVDDVVDVADGVVVEG